MSWGSASPPPPFFYFVCGSPKLYKVQWKGVSARQVIMQYERLANFILVFSPCLDMILNCKLVPCEILQPGLSNDMYNIGKLILNFDVSVG